MEIAQKEAEPVEQESVLESVGEPEPVLGPMVESQRTRDQWEFKFKRASFSIVAVVTSERRPSQRIIRMPKPVTLSEDTITDKTIKGVILVTLKGHSLGR